MKIVATLAGAMIGALVSSAAKAGVAENIIYSFTGGSDGANPYSPLVIDSRGASGPLLGLYGASGDGGEGNGTIFGLSPQGSGLPWALSVLWTFTGGADGRYPNGVFSATRHISGKTALYGTTSGGANGYGTIFSAAGGSLSTIWALTGGSDGGDPYFGVVADRSGALYTATFDGGSGGCGTVIQLTPPAQGQTAWTETTLYSFTGAADGCGPLGLIIDARGRLFGTTNYGGSQNSYCSQGGGCGTAFELVPPSAGQTGWKEKTIWTFQGGTDGASSFAPLTAGKNGVLYGTTQFGGSDACSYYSGCGTVFALTPPDTGSHQWTEQILAVFPPGGNSSVPEAAVILDQAGALYGTTSANFNGNGGVFRLAPPASGQIAWTLETLFNFAGGRTGSLPYGPLTADSTGTLYGTTVYGGLYGNGTIFSLAGTGFVP